MKLLLSSSRLGVILLASLVLTMTLRDSAHGKPTADDDDTPANGDDANKKPKKEDKKAGVDKPDAKPDAKPDKPGLDVTAIAADIIKSNRKVLLFAVRSNRLLVVVSALNAADKSLDGAVVFDQPSSTLSDTSITLTSAQLFKDKWPKVTATTGSLVVLRGSGKTYLVIINPGKLTFLDLATPTTIPIDKSIDSSGSSNYAQFFGPAIITLSTSKVMTVFSFSTISVATLNLFALQRGHLDGTDLTGFGSISNIDSRYPCQGQGQGQISFPLLQTRCTNPITWNILAGFVSSSSVYLVTSSSIIKFPGTALQSETPLGSTTTPSANFWVAKPPPTDSPTPSTVLTTTAKSHRTTYIIVGSVLLVILILVILGVAIGVFFYCKAKKKEKEDHKSGHIKSGSLPKSILSSTDGLGGKNASFGGGGANPTVLIPPPKKAGSDAGSKSSVSAEGGESSTMLKVAAPSSDVPPHPPPKEAGKPSATKLTPKRKTSKGSGKKHKKGGGGGSKHRGGSKRKVSGQNRKGSAGKLHRRGTSKQRKRSA